MLVRDEWSGIGEAIQNVNRECPGPHLEEPDEAIVSKIDELRFRSIFHHSASSNFGI
jgi:hypothetical protein